jgi:hypothetical protein
VLNTQELMQVFHLLQAMSRRCAAKTTVALDQEIAALASPEAAAFLAQRDNCTSRVAHGELLDIMERECRVVLKAKILASPYTSVTFDEARDGKRAQYGAYVRYWDKERGGAREALWKVLPEAKRRQRQPPGRAHLEARPLAVR